MKKILPLFFGASLLLNAALAYYAFTSPAADKTSAAAAATAKRAPAATAAQPVATSIDSEAWANLETKDLPDFVSRLRAAGFPIEMIRAILAAQMGESFAARRRALDPDADKRSFWKERPPNPQLDLAMRQSSREQQKMMRELLGKDAEGDDPMSAIIRGRRFDGLPPEKVDDVKAVMRDFEEKRQDLYADGYDINREKIVALDKAQHDAIARVLTPPELEEYDLRNSTTANSMRNSLLAFKPTEEEFRSIFRLQQAFDEKYNLNLIAIGPVLNEELMRERSNAQRLLIDQIKGVLSPDRAAIYDRATDNSYRQTSQLVARLELPAETTDQVYAIQKDIQQKVQAMNRATRDPQARNEQLAVIAQEASMRISGVLGSRGFEAYRQYGGNWMQQLQPRPMPTPGAPGVGGGGGGALRIVPGN